LTGERVERRLAAVLAADVAGYSRLMGSDEEGTLARLKAVRKALVDPTIAAHRGRIVKTTGDGMLVEFASAVDAVRSSAEVQRGMAEQNATLPQDQRIEFRIGIHVGDIIIDDNDIFGDGVNIAARLEGIAESGGVCISDDAYRQVRGKVEIACDDLGPQTLKNIAEPMRTWRVRLGGQGPAASQTDLSANPAPALPLPDKPSIAVLPFQNMSGDPEQEYFTDGMVEDIITALSRFKSLFVIARNSSFTYKGKAVEIKQVGRELGVRYVLEGSVRKAGGKVRITGQLIDAVTGAHLWADRFDGALDDIFELQDKVTSSVVAAIAPRLEQAEIERSERKPTESLDAIELYYHAIHSYRHWTRQGNEDALRLARQAISLDPNFAAAYGVATACYDQRYQQVWITDDDIAEGKFYASRAVELGDDAFALSRAAHFFGVVLKDAGAADTIVDQALALNHNLSEAWRIRGFVSTYLGRHEPAIEQFYYALRLNPLDPQIYYLEAGLAQANFYLRRFEVALSWATKSMAHHKKNYVAPVRLAMASYAMLGRIADAQMMQARMRETGADLTISFRRKQIPFQRQEDVDLDLEALRIAGVPE